MVRQGDTQWSTFATVSRVYYLFTQLLLIVLYTVTNWPASDISSRSCLTLSQSHDFIPRAIFHIVIG